MEMLGGGLVPIDGRQALLQLRGAELRKALPYLQRGTFGLEVGDFASPQLLDGNWQQQLQDLRPLLQGLPGPLTMHGPFLDLSPASPEPGLRRLTSERYRLALQIAGALRARYLVLHTQWNPNLRQPDYRERWVEGNCRFWEDLLPAVEEAGTTVLFENMWDAAPDHLVQLLDRLPAGRFAACLDAGHASIFSPLTWQSWAQVLGERLAYVHLSDNHLGWDQHLALGQGSIDFSRLLRALDQQNLHPWLVLEVPGFSDVEDSLEHLGWGHLLE
jgi:sugar phosphate isomerase/epimerase